MLAAAGAGDYNGHPELQTELNDCYCYKVAIIIASKTWVLP